MMEMHRPSSWNTFDGEGPPLKLIDFRFARKANFWKYSAEENKQNLSAEVVDEEVQEYFSKNVDIRFLSF